MIFLTLPKFGNCLKCLSQPSKTDQPFLLNFLNIEQYVYRSSKVEGFISIHSYGLSCYSAICSSNILSFLSFLCILSYSILYFNSSNKFYEGFWLLFDSDLMMKLTNLESLSSFNIVSSSIILLISCSVSLCLFDEPLNFIFLNSLIKVQFLRIFYSFTSF